MLGSSILRLWHCTFPMSNKSSVLSVVVAIRKLPKHQIRWYNKSNQIEDEVERRVKIISSTLNGMSKSSFNTAKQSKHTKIIHFQRHGQGYHNLMWRIYDNLGLRIDLNDIDPIKNPFVRPEIVDSPLTAKGKMQCVSKKQQASQLNPELIIVSPLLRTMQTAHITFSDFRKEEKIPWLAHDGCREELGLLVCNKCRSVSEISDEFPYVDISNIESGENDKLWISSKREPSSAQSQRIYNFLTDFIRKRKEKEIAIVGHSAWFYTMCNEVMDCGDDEKLKSVFDVSEIRSMCVTFQDYEATYNT